MRQIVKLVAAFALSICLLPCWARAAEIEHLKLKDGSDAIMVIGDIEAGDDEKFRKLTLAHQSAIVALDSQGGLLLPALEIGKMIRLRGYVTLVLGDATCASSCALMWLAGSPRMAEQGAKIGFHASYLKTGGVPIETGVGNALVGSYLNLLGLPERAVIFATSAPPGRLRWLDLDELGTSGIEARVLDATPGSTPASPKPPSVVVTVPGPRKAVPYFSETQLRAELSKVLRDPATASAAAAAAGLGPRERVLFESHLRSLYSDDRYLSLLASRLFSRRGEFAGTDSEYNIGRQIGAETVTDIQMKGLALLDDQSIRSYFFYLDALPRYATVDECKTVFSPGVTSQSGNLEMQIMARISPEAFASYLQLLRRAGDAGLRGAEAPSLNSRQTEDAQRAFEKALEVELRRMTAEERGQVSAALDDPAQSDAASVCRSYQSILSVAYRLPGNEGNWFRRTFVANMQEPSRPQ